MTRRGPSRRGVAVQVIPIKDGGKIVAQWQEDFVVGIARVSAEDDRNDVVNFEATRNGVELLRTRDAGLAKIIHEGWSNRAGELEIEGDEGHGHDARWV